MSANLENSAAATGLEKVSCHSSPKERQCQRVFKLLYSSVQSLSCVWLFETRRTAARHAFLSIINSQSLLKLMSIESVMPSNHLILCHRLLFLPSIFPTIRDFFNESVLHIRSPKYWSFNFNVSPSNEYSGLTSFRIDWLDLLAVQGTLKSLLEPGLCPKAILVFLGCSFLVSAFPPFPDEQFVLKGFSS